MNGKYSVKFELDLLEQTYKFRDGSGIKDAEDVTDLLTDDIYESVIENFINMKSLRQKMLHLQSRDQFGFENII